MVPNDFESAAGTTTASLARVLDLRLARNSPGSAELMLTTRPADDPQSGQAECGMALQLLIALNFGTSPRRFSFESRAHLLLSTHLDRDPAPLSSPSILRENEGAILRLVG
jgi:hypothetical protein